MFGSKPKEKTREEWLADNLPGAVADVPRQRAAEDVLFVEYQAALAADASAWSLRVEKFGNALAIFAEGLAGWGPNKVVTKELHAVNLIASPNVISVIEGRAPDMLGTKFAHTYYSGKYEWLDHSNRAYTGTGAGFFLKTDPKPDKSATSSYSMTYSGDLNYMIDDTARPYEPDRIRFEGAGATLVVPYGLGADAYAKVLAALAEKPL